MKKLMAVAATALAFLPGVGAGLAVLLDPLRRRSGQSRWAWIATLDALPADGMPRKFPVLMDRVDAWNKASNVPVGAVYLRRVGSDGVQALNAVCPHAGCFVTFQGEDYICPCHDSSFRVDGALKSRRSPSPRGMDELEAEVREGSQVWVRFQNFQAGTAEKIAVG